MKPITIILFYASIISLISMIVCIYDKVASKHFTKHRTRESSLILLSAIGGSVVMYLTMQIIRHKTKHKKFMIGIPVIIVLQIAALVCTHLFVVPLF